MLDNMLQYGDENFVNIFNMAPVGFILIDEQETISMINDAALDYLNDDMGKGIGKKFGDALLCSGRFESNKGCKYGSACKTCQINKGITLALVHNVSTPNIEINKFFVKKDKCIELWFKTSIIPIQYQDKKSVLIVLVDITDKKSKEIELSKSRDYYLSMFECFPSVIWKTDIEGKIEYINERYCEFTGRGKKASHKMDFLECIHPEDRDKFYRLIEKAVQKIQPYEMIVRVKHHTGQYRWVQSMIRPFYDLENHFTGYIGTGMDITDRIFAEEDLEKAKLAAEKANKIKSEFLANMSHEIRTPLNGIVGMIDLTLFGELSMEQKDNLMIAKICANQLLKVINDILDFSKMEAGKLVIEKLDFNLKEMIADVAKAHQSYATQKSIEITYEISQDIPEILVGDSHRVLQILNNLINNAIKFTDKGKVKITIKKIKAFEDCIVLQFCVEDSGIGISEADIGKLFKSFSQVDGSFTKKFGGTGLGLVISKQLTEMMGGNIWVESTQARGSRFYFTIQLGVSSNQEVKEETQFSMTPVEYKCQVLLAEDDKVNCTVIQRILVNRGYLVDIVHNGLEAIDKITQKQYDIVLMDIQMPVMDGVEATHKIRNLNKDVPIIALTAYALKGDREKFLAYGMNEYVSKPIHIDALYRAMDKCLALKKQNQDIQNVAICMDDNGEVLFKHKACEASDKKECKYLLKLSYLVELSDLVEQLGRGAQENEVEAIEKLAHKIKDLSVQIGMDALKDVAFKIELAARRGDFKELAENAKNVKEIYDTFKTNNFLGGKVNENINSRR